MIEKLRFEWCTRKIAAIGVFALLASCQTLPDVGRELRDTYTAGESSTTRNASAVEGSGPGYHATEETGEVVTLDRSSVRHLQSRLAESGFNPGPIDGLVGPRTTAAIKRYQSAHHLPTTGRISSRLMEHLNATLGGSNAGSQTPISLEPKSFPTHQPGTTFIYSNGETDRVLGAEGAAVKWIRSDGTTYTAHRNFLLPWSNWISNNKRGTATISEAADALWPLREGVEVTFFAKVIVQSRNDPDGTERRVDQWRCQNDGRREVTVWAGTFQTLMFVCRRGANPGSPAVIRTWYYAQDIGHYVRFAENLPDWNTTRTVDLVAVLPNAPDWPPIVRAALARAVVHTLEMPENESQMVWTSSGVDTRVTIEAESRFLARSGRPCRRFKQIWSEDGSRRPYPSLACKATAGGWQIPGLKGDQPELLVTSGKIPNMPWGGSSRPHLAEGVEKVF